MERNSLLREELGQQERLAVAGQLTAAFAHEVGTPLNLVNSHLQLLNGQTDLSDRTRERLGVIQAQIERVGEIVIRRQINFATDSDVIDASSTPPLAEIADVMLRNPQITKIELQGHTDNVGSADHNLDLSQRRADSVRRWLVEQGGVEAGRLEAKGYGATRPLVPNITPSNRARNRRSQFIIVEQTTPTP